MQVTIYIPDKHNQLIKEVQELNQSFSGTIVKALQMYMDQEVYHHMPEQVITVNKGDLHKMVREMINNEKV